MTRKHLIAFFLVAAVGASFDLISKHYAFHHVQSGFSEVEVVPDFFSFGRTVNPGIIFGLGPKYSTIFLVISVIALPVITGIFLRLKSPTWTMTVSLGLILAGTIGNLWDRAFSMAGMVEFLGMYEGEVGVRDFIKFYSGERIFPLFNLADSCICVGVGILSVEMMCFDEKGPKKGKWEPPPPDKSADQPEGGDDTLPVPMARNVPEDGATEHAPSMGEETAPIPKPAEETRPIPKTEEKTGEPGKDVPSES